MASITMGALTPYGQLLRSARTGISYVPRRTLTYNLPRRAQESGSGNNGPNDKPEPPRESPSMLGSLKSFFTGKKSEKPKLSRPAPQKREGELGADSIFADPEATAKEQAAKSAEKQATKGDYSVEKRNNAHMQAALNPNPKARLRWERKMVIREVRHRGRLSKTLQIMRTERESTSKTHWLKTSVKKLGPLARQIAGKNIDEAMVQMRFSKKKAAKDVLKHLEHAKNIAVVQSGMGLGEVQGENVGKKPTNILLKTGERKTITDPTSIYIDQAWVNRGPYDRAIEYRARGRANFPRPPWTSLSLILKEEKTRIREWQDREATALRKRKAQLWTHLPDRKISAQNQYYSW